MNKPTFHVGYNCIDYMKVRLRFSRHSAYAEFLRMTVFMSRSKPIRGRAYDGLYGFDYFNLCVVARHETSKQCPRYT